MSFSITMNNISPLETLLASGTIFATFHYNNYEHAETNFFTYRAIGGSETTLSGSLFQFTLRMLTPPYTYFFPTLGLACVLMLRLISPELVSGLLSFEHSSNKPNFDIIRIQCVIISNGCVSRKQETFARLDTWFCHYLGLAYAPIVDT